MLRAFSQITLTLSIPFTKSAGFVDSVDQDQTAQNMESDL